MARYELRVDGLYRDGSLLPTSPDLGREELAAIVESLNAREAKIATQGTLCRSVVEVEILSVDPVAAFDLDSLRQLAAVTAAAQQAGAAAPATLEIRVALQNARVPAGKMVALLRAQGRDPAILGLDSDGNSVAL